MAVRVFRCRTRFVGRLRIIYGGRDLRFGRLDDAAVARAAENPMENRRDADDENTADGSVQWS